MLGHVQHGGTPTSLIERSSWYGVEAANAVADGEFDPMVAFQGGVVRAPWRGHRELTQARTPSSGSVVLRQRNLPPASGIVLRRDRVVVVGGVVATGGTKSGS